MNARRPDSRLWTHPRGYRAHRGWSGRRRAPSVAGLSLVFGALLLHPAKIQSQTMAGSVVEEGRGTPVSGAVITLLAREGGVRASAVSDSLGRFVMVPPEAGEYFIEVARLGYKTTRSLLLSLTVEGSVPIELMMRPEPLGLEGIEVSVEREAEEFLQPFGHTPASLGRRWISRSNIEALPLPLGPREVIKWQRLAGVWVDELTGGPFDDLCVRFMRRSLRECAIVVINGVTVSSGEVQLISPDEIEAIAILTPVDATTFYGTGAGGGAVLIWTRRGGR